MRPLVLALLLLLSLPALAAANEPPSCRDDHLPSVAGVGFGADCTDPDGDALNYEVVTEPAHGTLTQFSPGSFSYSAHSGFHGDDTMRYVARDPGGLASDPATVTVTTGWPKPECSPFAPPTVVAGLSTGLAFCWGERLEVVVPPQHGTFAFRRSGDSLTPIYTADAGTTATTDALAIRVVTPDGASPEYRFDIALQAAAPAPADLVIPLLAAPAIDAKVTFRTHRAVKRSGLPLALSCDIECRLSATVTHGGRVVGRKDDLRSGGAVGIPLAGRLRRGMRLTVTVDASAAQHAPSRLRFRVRLR